MIQPFVTVKHATGAYPVFVGRDLLDRAGDVVKRRGRAFVITSDALRERFAARVAKSFSADVITIEEGEAKKTLATAETIIDALLDRGAKRDSMAIVVGGGMIGDSAGFAASIFLRGIDLVQIPTTLLAQVDSSIGGKVGVNHRKGKNLIGSFHQPRAVISDTSALDTLPRRELLSGLFEAMKGGVIGDPELFALFERREEVLALEPSIIDDIVRRKIRIKADIVSSDEREAGRRRLLNYGHTIGHGIEAATGYSALTHGEAVAWGMVAANAIAVRRGLLSREDAKRIDAIIAAYDPPPIPRIGRAAVLAATEHDKKNTGNTRVMVLPRAIGRCDIVDDVSEDDVAYGVAAVCAS